MRVGVAGLGVMGAAVAARLMEVGHDVTVWNRSPEKTKPLAEAGAKVAATPAELASAVEATITMLTDGAAIDAVYNGPNGLLAGDVKGKLFIEMSTVPPKVPDRARAQGARERRGVCRMSGRRVDRAGAAGQAARPDGRRAGRCRTRQIRSSISSAGGSSIAARSAPAPSMKLAINLPLMVAWQAYGEAFAIAGAAGWEPKRLLDLFVDTNGANPAMKNRADMIVTMFEGRDPGPTTFSIANGVKDLRTMVETGEARGADMRATKAALSGFEDATAHGFGGGDGSRMSVYWAGRKKS